MTNIHSLLIDDSQYFEKIKKYNHIIVYGAGNKAKLTIPLLENKGIVPCVVCDGNSALWGKTFLGKYPICSYEQATSKFSNYCILICATVHVATEIIEELGKKGEKNPIYHCCNLFKVDSRFLSTQDYLSNLDRYSAVYDLLEDDLSKQIYIEFLNSKMTGSMFSLQKLTDGDTFFDQQLLGPCSSDDVYVDAGAYTGDTLCRFIAYSGLRYKKAILFEADEANFCALKNFVDYGVVPHTQLMNCALWSEKAEKKFYTLTDNHNLHFDSPNLFNDFNEIADNTSLFTSEKQHTSPIAQRVQTVTLDSALENELPTIMKINALAADLPILEGSVQTLKRCCPDIILEYGVRPEYILSEVEFLTQLNLGYRFYLRQKSIFGDNKTILYALGGKRHGSTNET